MWKRLVLVGVVGALGACGGDAPQPHISCFGVSGYCQCRWTLDPAELESCEVPPTEGMCCASPDWPAAGFCGCFGVTGFRCWQAGAHCECHTADRERPPYTDDVTACASGATGCWALPDGGDSCHCGDAAAPNEVQVAACSVASMVLSFRCSPETVQAGYCVASH